MSHPENRSVAHRSSLQRPSWARPQSTTLIWDSVWFPGWMVIYGLEPLRSYRLINLRSNKKGWHLEYEPHHSASFPAQPALFARLFQPEWYHTKCINFVKKNLQRNQIVPGTYVPKKSIWTYVAWRVKDIHPYDNYINSSTPLGNPIMAYMFYLFKQNKSISWYIFIYSFYTYCNAYIYIYIYTYVCVWWCIYIYVYLHSLQFTKCRCILYHKTCVFFVIHTYILDGLFPFEHPRNFP